MQVIDKPSTEASREAPPVQPVAPPPPRPRTGLLLAAMGLGAAVAMIGFMVLRHPETGPRLRPRPPAPAATVNPAGIADFRLSESEIRALRIEPVLERSFRSERVAEGRITVNEERSTPILPPFAGRIVRLHAQLGDRVEAGAPLFDVDSPQLSEAATALLAAVDGLGKAASALAQARREEARQRSLFAARATSQRELEEARTALLAAESEHRIAEATLAAARQRLLLLGRSPEQVAAIEERRQVSGTITVTSPFAGVVTQRRASLGAWIGEGQGEPVMTVSDLSTLWLVAAVREADAPLIRVGMPLTVQVGALPGRDFPARIVRTGAGIDPATRRLAIFAEVQDPEGLLRPEMFATFRIAISEPRLSPAVPASAVIWRGQEASLWVALDGNRFARRQVELGARDGEMYEVRSGLSAGERVVTGGALFIDRAARVD
ncbi:MAG: efflux RND transporter periplasmic adaptor subunit [Rhodovarius sp.]|nr:efflux RND transporter periplasmic adaptor subunit [Rhodovarius sp.]